MSAGHTLAEHVLDLLGDDSETSLRRFFGGWSIDYGGRQIAIVMDTVYAKVPVSRRERWRTAGSRCFAYRAQGRTVNVETYWSLPDDALDDPAELRRLLLES
ncbi:DNA transformation protein [Lipingzhangella halophila]|uniref:DNA transformation protein n=1 Tax=Lipingzhangella halophila TaxID=1783352 RepID=A0A7W7RNX3_9ACTN|nr:TfoX/Sxy family protein [Lipingzhangella halophila]MBB4935464.1 DNA transformation protein [Lipingzhangella halophila]